MKETSFWSGVSSQQASCFFRAEGLTECIFNVAERCRNLYVSDLYRAQVDAGKLGAFLVADGEK